MSNLKFVEAQSEALSKLLKEVGDNSYVCYSVSDFPATDFAACYPKSYLDKCVSVSVITSGDASALINWMAIVPFRVDHSGNAGQKVYDQDPFVIAFGTGGGTSAPSGMIAYHQNYEGRTSLISGCSSFSKPEAIANLRASLITGKYEASEAPQSVTTALQHAAKLFLTKTSFSLTPTSFASETGTLDFSTSQTQTGQMVSGVLSD